MKTIIVSDIFGRTEALDTLASKIAEPIEIIAPYGSMNMGFADEAEAYEYFNAKVGLECYSRLVSEHIKTCRTPVRLVGFSVGASAIWNISGSVPAKYVVEAIGFYSSQIRFNLSVKPRFPVKLILPLFEQHFSIPELIEDLAAMENVTVEQTPFLHGFMNTHSINYDQNGYDYGLRRLCENVPFTSTKSLKIS